MDVMTELKTSPTGPSPIARLRIACGLTQAQLAALIGCPQQHISRWEKGERNPGIKSLIALAAALNCDINDLLPKKGE